MAGGVPPGSLQERHRLVDGGQIEDRVNDPLNRLVVSPQNPGPLLFAKLPKPALQETQEGLGKGPVAAFLAAFLAALLTPLVSE